MEEKNENTESKRRTQVNDLPQPEQELSTEEQKKIQGGVIRSVGNRDGGGTNAIGGGDIGGQDS